ncbi:MAG: hypothetical protein GY868_20065 [Deltaproteobacteria bacterium]|nr:hypothetical protein [Deltaproteobacteria bacterium]
MKINSDIYPLKELKGEKQQQQRPADTKKTAQPEDTVTISQDSLRLVIDENRSAAETQILDFKKAEQEVSYLKGQLLQNAEAAVEIHQLGAKNVLFLATDDQE